MARPRIAIAVLSLVAAGLALRILASGAAVLETVLPGGLPLGNALAVVFLCGAALPALVLSRPRTRLRSAAAVSLAGAVAWLPASVALAGNLELDFANGRGAAWLAFSAIVLADILCTLLWALAASLYARYRRGSQA